MSLLIQISGDSKTGFFCCGLVLENHIVVEAPPKLTYMINWDSNRVHQYCIRRNWRLIKVTQPAEEVEAGYE